MKKLFALGLLLTASCSSQEAEIVAPDAKPGASSSYAGSGRDRMCLVDGKSEGAVITYAAAGDANCSLRFTTRYDNQERTSGNLIAANDPSCTVSFRTVIGAQSRFTLGPPTSSCAYYCGPGATLSGKTFVRMEKQEPVADIAGDPLC